MNGSQSLPRLVVAVLRLVVPQGSHARAIEDLDEEFAAVRRARTATAAYLWLGREATSILFAYAAARLASWWAQGPIYARDAKLVVRDLRRRPIATLAVSGMLAAGLLAVLVTSGLATALLFRPLSAAHPDALRRLAAIGIGGQVALRMSNVELQLVAETLDRNAIVTSVNLQPVLLRVNNADIQTMAEAVDGHYFSVMGVRTVLGRGLLTTDNRVGAAPVVVISPALWREQFRSAADAVGQTLQLNGARFTIIGVAASTSSTSFLGASVDAWVPTQQSDPLLNRDWRINPRSRWFTAFLLPDVSVAQLKTRLALATTELRRVYPEIWRERQLDVVPAFLLTGAQRSTAILLIAVLASLSTLILAVSVANLGGVLLAQAAVGRKQAVIHLAIGSGRAAILRRHAFEGACLGVLGAIIALALYVWARTWFAEIALLPTLSLRLDLPLNGVVIARVVAAAICAGASLALGPALWVTRLDLAAGLRDAGMRLIEGRSTTRTRRLLVSTQVCLSLALIVAATLFAQSLRALETADVGFSRDRLVAVDFDLEPATVPGSELALLARAALTRVATISGITNAAMSNRAPVDQSTPTIEVNRTMAEQEGLTATTLLITTDYFDTLELKLVTGRAFSQAETDNAAPVVIVNEALAARLFPSGDALDRAVYIGDTHERVRVVGIATNSKYRSLSEALTPHVYRPTAPTLGLTLIARTTADPHAALRAMQRELDSVGPGVVGFFPRTFEDHLAIDLLPTRVATAAARALSLLALVFSGVGLYGMVSWFVTLRRREIGVRMIMGASAASVRLLVVRQALSAALPGIVMGLLVSGVLAYGLRSALFGVRLLNGYAIGIGLMALLAVVLAASYVPSRRATAVDPAVVLRV